MEIPPAASPANELERLPDNRRKDCEDKAILSNISNANWSNVFFTRLVAKRRTFTRVDFKYSIFDACYFRDSTFDSCNFTGCRFLSCNLHGAKFTGCNFEYATFERTTIDASILDVGCPGLENLKMRFARSLRVNFQQIGDTQAANKAVRVELDAESAHLLKAWRSNESYYRKKYAGLDRAKMFFQWVAFKGLDFTWGNGESVLKLIRFVGIIFAAIAIADYLTLTPLGERKNALLAVCRAPQIFFGVIEPEEFSKLWLTAIVFARLVTFGFFMSVIIKRFNRR